MFEGSEQGMVALIVVLAILIVAWAVWQGTRDGKRAGKQDRAKPAAVSPVFFAVEDRLIKADRRALIEFIVDQHVQIEGVKKLLVGYERAVGELANDVGAMRGVVNANAVGMGDLRGQVAAAGLKITDLERGLERANVSAGAAIKRMTRMDQTIATIAGKLVAPDVVVEPLNASPAGDTYLSGVVREAKAVEFSEADQEFVLRCACTSKTLARGLYAAIKANEEPRYMERCTGCACTLEGVLQVSASSNGVEASGVSVLGARPRTPRTPDAENSSPAPARAPDYSGAEEQAAK